MRMAKLRNTDNSKCWWDKDQMELLFIVAGIMNWHRHFGKLIVSIINLGISYSPSNVAPRYTLKNKSATRNMYKNGQSSTPSSRQNQVAIQIPPSTEQLKSGLFI